MSRRFEHDHLKRLKRIWIEDPVYLITCVTKDRRPLLANPQVHEIFVEVWTKALSLYGWSVGHYVIMPDHVHFFGAASRPTASTLSFFCGKWKEWTSKYCQQRLDIPHSLWQAEFHDWLIRSESDLHDKHEYVSLNPVRKGLVPQADHWPYQGCLHTQ